ncbi:UNVERIFIED_CONTAM: hypothetical protein RMT77_011436 [Armadillidium vulgare]
MKKNVMILRNKKKKHLKNFVENFQLSLWFHFLQVIFGILQKKNIISYFASSSNFLQRHNYCLLFFPFITEIFSQTYGTNCTILLHLQPTHLHLTSFVTAFKMKGIPHQLQIDYARRTALEQLTFCISNWGKRKT